MVENGREVVEIRQRPFLWLILGRRRLPRKLLISTVIPDSSGVFLSGETQP
jgi:hypothetical protein